jgi:hypothetical protein
LAAEYGLYPTYKEEFHQVFDEHQSKDKFRQLMVRMKVINSEGESSMSEDEWEAASTSLTSPLFEHTSDPSFLSAQIFILPSLLKSDEYDMLTTFIKYPYSTAAMDQDGYGYLAAHTWA